MKRNLSHMRHVALSVLSRAFIAAAREPAAPVPHASVRGYRTSDWMSGFTSVHIAAERNMQCLPPRFSPEMVDFLHFL